MTMLQRLFRLAWMPAVVAFVFVSGTLATDVPRKAYTGKITEISDSGPRIVVQGPNAASRIFEVTSSTAIVTEGNPNAKLGDLKVGDRVNVSYTEEGEKFEAHRIECTSSGEVP